jgi:succinate dehydrogenase/fumarate reductase flavoprotein subunit
VRQESRGAHYRSDFPKLDDKRFKINIYCRKKGKRVSTVSAEMILFKQNVKEIKGPLSGMLRVHVKAAHKREFE